MGVNDVWDMGFTICDSDLGDDMGRAEQSRALPKRGKETRRDETRAPDSPNRKDRDKTKKIEWERNPQFQKGKCKIQG